jgi:hypothetical protein
MIGAWVVVLSVAASCGFLNKRDPVVLEKESATTARHLLDRASIKLKSLSKGEGALTTWFYRCSNVLTYEVDSETSLDQTVSVGITVTGATMHIGLNMDVFLKLDAPPQLRAHEDGHLKICQEIYDGAEASARRATQSVLGRKFSGTGAGRKQALENALNRASEAICSTYRADTAVLANKVSNAYDRITNNGQANVDVDDAIKMAFQEVKQ